MVAQSAVLLILSLLLAVLSTVCMAFRIAWPYHRWLGVACALVGVVCVVQAIRVQRARLRRERILVKRAWRHYAPHVVVALILIVAVRVTTILVPFRESPLTGMESGSIRGKITEDRAILAAADVEMTALLGRLESALPAVPAELLPAWQQFMTLSEQYGDIARFYQGFHQLDYSNTPELHADAFMVAMQAFVSRFVAAQRMAMLLEGKAAYVDLLNQAGELYGPDSYYAMKNRLTDGETLLRLNAGAAYLSAVDQSVTLGDDVVARLRYDLETAYRGLGQRPELVLQRPLDKLERLAVEVWYPLIQGGGEAAP